MNEGPVQTKEQVAFTLAARISVAEGAEKAVTRAGAREYWLRLYDQCLALVHRSNSIEDVVKRAKSPHENP